MPELAGVSWAVLARLTASALAGRDKQVLIEINEELHRRFLEGVLAGDNEARDELIRLISTTLERKEVARLLPRGLEATLADWRHLAVLSQILEEEAEPVEEGRRLVGSLAHAPRLVGMLAGEETKWIRVGEVAKRLKVAAPNVSRLNRALESAGVVERKKVGRSVYVRLGPVGRLLAGTK